MDVQSEWAGGEVDRGRMVWELLADQVWSAAEVWWTGRCSAYSKLELAQIKMGRR